MTTVFSDFVRDFDVESEHHERVINAIVDVLTKELRRRGIFQYGPSLLGYGAGSSWDNESLHDLAFDCLLRSIVDRLPRLLALLHKNGSIDGLIIRNIKNFIGEKQQAQDPVGYAVYQNLKEVLPALAEAGKLHTLYSNSGYVPGFHSDARFATGQSHEPLATEAQIKEAMFGSGSMFEGLPALATVGNKAQVILTEALCCLKDFGIASFTVESMRKAICSLITESVAVVPGNGRSIVSDFFEDFSENFRTVLPDAGYEEKESFEHTLQQMREEIDRSPRSAAVRKRLQQLLELASQASAGKIPLESFSVPELQSTLGIERTTVYHDIEYLASIRERVTAQLTLVKKNGDRNG